MSCVFLALQFQFIFQSRQTESKGITRLYLLPTTLTYIFLQHAVCTTSTLEKLYSKDQKCPTFGHVPVCGSQDQGIHCSFGKFSQKQKRTLQWYFSGKKYGSGHFEGLSGHTGDILILLQVKIQACLVTYFSPFPTTYYYKNLLI